MDLSDTWSVILKFLSYKDLVNCLLVNKTILSFCSTPFWIERLKDEKFERYVFTNAANNHSYDTQLSNYDWLKEYHRLYSNIHYALRQVERVKQLVNLNKCHLHFIGIDFQSPFNPTDCITEMIIQHIRGNKFSIQTCDNNNYIAYHEIYDINAFIYNLYINAPTRYYYYRHENITRMSRKELRILAKTEHITKRRVAIDKLISKIQQDQHFKANLEVGNLVKKIYAAFVDI